MDWIIRLFGAALSALSAVVLIGGLVEKLSAADAVDWPAPKLSPPAQVPYQLNSTTSDSLIELPVSDAARPVGETEPTELQASPLATATPIEERSEQLEQVARQADRRTRHGYELAERGAYFAARSEFIGALRLVAEGLDNEQKTNRHGRALAAAITALKEAEIFLPDGSRLETDLDLPGIIASHDTPVLKDNAEGVTSLAALRCYLTFAQEQFACAAGHEVAGSMALHALGKLHATLARKNGLLIVAPESKAVVFYQSALLTYPENPLASNDLGVLLAQCGRYDDARPILEHSVTRFPQSTGWRNLSVVYQQLRQPALAQQAAEQANLLRGQELARQKASPTVGNSSVQWVNPETFASYSTSPLATPRAIPAQSVVKPRAEVPPAAIGRTTNPPSSRAPSSTERMSWGTRAYQR